jgi:hypothetical protein
MGDWELKALRRTGGFCRERLVGVDRHLEKTYKSISYISNRAVIEPSQAE